VILGTVMAQIISVKSKNAPTPCSAPFRANCFCFLMQWAVQARCARLRARRGIDATLLDTAAKLS
jgi:hypothetical protein